MVLLHRRKLLIRTFLALVSVALLAACGGGAVEETAGEQPSAATDRGEGARLGPVANGDPMPPAEEAAGAIPYPGAVVWMRVERPPSEFEAIDAFTPDSFLQVVAFYDRELADWRRTVAADAVTYHRDPEVASLIVSPWLGEEVPEGAPAVLRQARTSIGLAWRKGS